MATETSKPYNGGKPLLEKIDEVTGAHVARDRGRSTIDDILSDGKPSMIRIMADGARFDYDRAMAVRAQAEACPDQKQKEKLEEEASRLHQLASKQAKEPAAYLHPKLSSIDHNGLPAAPMIGSVNVAVLSIFDRMHGQIEQAKTIDAEGAEIPQAQTLEEVATNISDRIRQMISLSRPPSAKSE